METIQIKKVKKMVPELRFKEFKDKWELHLLRDFIAKIESGWSPICLTEPAHHGEWGSLKTTSITWGGYNPNENKKLPNSFEPRKSLEVHIDDILITRVGPKDRVGVVVHVDKTKEKLMVSDNMFRLMLKGKIHPSFLPLVLGSNIVQKSWKQKIAGLASAQVVINQQTLNKTILQIPTLPEQQKISSFLSTVDEKIQQLTRKKELLEQYKKGVMQQLFLGKLRFKDDNGEDYVDWEEKKLGDVAKFRRGSFPQPYGLPKWYDDENGMPFIQVYDVDHNMLLKKTTKNKISKLGAEQSVFVKKGTLVITIQGSIGRIAKTQYDAYVDRTLLIFQSYKLPTDVDYFKYVVFLLFEIEKTKAPGGTIKTITKEVLTDFIVPIPCLKEQQKIAAFLSSVDTKIESTNQQINQMQSFKKGLLQQLFV